MSTGSFGAWMFWTMFLTALAVVVLALAFRDRRDNLLATTGQHAAGYVLGVGYDSEASAAPPTGSGSSTSMKEGPSRPRSRSASVTSTATGHARASA
ncbi:MAG TPA: hypothetical protein VGI64_08115 [Streptosporangiaceae bacterium]